VSKANRKTTT